jgi:RNA recognition motif-containing protein
MEGRPFGFVEFSSMDAAAAAVDELSGQELDGNVVRINLA